MEFIRPPRSGLVVGCCAGGGGEGGMFPGFVGAGGGTAGLEPGSGETIGCGVL